MDFSHSEKVRDLQERVSQFMDKHVYPGGSRCITRRWRRIAAPAIPGR